MSTTVTAYVKAGHLKLLQEAMKGYSFRFMFNPYPIKPNDPLNSKWCIGIDYGSGPTEDIQEFERFWARLEMPIVEVRRESSLLHAIKPSLKVLAYFVKHTFNGKNRI